MKDEFQGYIICSTGDDLPKFKANTKVEAKIHKLASTPSYLASTQSYLASTLALALTLGQIIIYNIYLGYLDNSAGCTCLLPYFNAK